jgi:cytochrome c-type biogenesis protein CcmH/NrfG
MNPDRLAELEDERRFLLRSLADLDRELDAGDVDQHDFEVLRDGYTARAANVLRAIDEGRSALPPRRTTNPRVVAAVIVGVLALAVLSGWLVARSSGQRLAGETMTGGQAVDDVAALLVQARSQLLDQDFRGAADTYARVAELDPSNSEARTYTAWLLVVDSQQQPEATATAMVAAALAGFERVGQDDPGYADAHCLYAVAVGRFTDPPDMDLVAEQRRLCEANDPPNDVLGLVTEQLGPSP